MTTLLERAHDTIADIDLTQAISTIEAGLIEARSFGVDQHDWMKNRLTVVRLIRLQQLRLELIQDAIKEAAKEVRL